MKNLSFQFTKKFGNMIHSLRVGLVLLALLLIAKNGKPVARLTRLSNRKSTALIGAFAGKLHMAEDFDAIPVEFEKLL